MQILTDGYQSSRRQLPRLFRPRCDSVLEATEFLPHARCRGETRRRFVVVMARPSDFFQREPPDAAASCRHDRRKRQAAVPRFKSSTNHRRSPWVFSCWRCGKKPLPLRRAKVVTTELAGVIGQAACRVELMRIGRLGTAAPPKATGRSNTERRSLHSPRPASC